MGLLFFNNFNISMPKVNPKNAATLASHIKWVIGNRIVLCLILLSVAVFITSTYDVFSEFQQSKKNLDSESKDLADFIVAQSLIDNQLGITAKLNDLNETLSGEKFEWEPKKVAGTMSEIQWKFPFSWLYSFPVKDRDGSTYGYIKVSGSYLYDNTVLKQLIIKFSLLFFFSTMIFGLLYPLGKRIPQDLFIAPIMSLLSLLKNRSDTTNEINSELPLELREVQAKITELFNEVAEHSREAASWQIATQVAHDIRSPLLVLNVETSDIPSIPERKRVAIKNAIQRVNDIANNLLAQYKQEKNKNDDTLSLSSELVATMLDSIVSEKRTQILTSNPSIQIDLDINSDVYSSFVTVDSAEFKRVLSNIINNSIESIKKDGLIKVRLSKDVEKIVITIIDNGCGIAKDKLPLVLEEGISFGKKQGLGLGLSYAVNKIHSWDGDYLLTSEVGEGTKFEIILPGSETPDWFACELNFVKDSVIVVLDDDEFIHEVWDKRIFSDSIRMHSLNIKHFYFPEELIKYYKDHLSKQKVNFLLDYELIGSELNGLSVSEKLNVVNFATLVTNRYEDDFVREACRNLGMKIVPKLFAPFIPIRIADTHSL